MTKRRRIDYRSYGLLILPLLVIGLIVALRIANKEVYEYNSKAVYVYNLTDDKKVYTHNEDEKLPMASLTKMMTVLVSLEKVSNLDAIAPVDTASYQKLVEENASMAGFFGDETTTFRDLMYGAMLPSGGEASKSLALDISGSELTFVTLMNEKAAELELTNTHFQNADGMDELGHYSSAKDMAMLLKYALDNPVYREIFTSKDYVTGPTNHHPEGLYFESTVFKKLNEHELSDTGIIGGKSGTTDKAGQCWATLVTKNGKEYIIVVMGAPYEDIDNPEDGHLIDTLDIIERL